MNIPLSLQQLNRLKPFKKEALTLLNKSLSVRKKKKALQKGGFISAIIAPILGLLGSLVGEIITKRKKK